MTARNNNIPAILFILALTFFAGLYRLGAHGLWLDEKVSLTTAMGVEFPENDLTDGKAFFTPKIYWDENNSANVIKATITRENSGNALLYSLLLHYWIKAFGNTDFILRFLSLLFNCAAAVLSYRLALRIFNSFAAALISGILFGIYPIFVVSSQFARAYSLAAFFTLLSTLFLFRIITEKVNPVRELSGFSNGVNSRVFLYYSLSSTAALFSHYFTAYILCAHIVAIALFVRDKKTCFKFSAALLMPILAFGLWLVIGCREALGNMAARSSAWGYAASHWKVGDNPWLMPANFKNIMAGWAQLLLPAFGNYFQSMALPLRRIMFLLPIPLLLIAFPFFGRVDKSIKNRMYILLILIFSAPVFITLLAVKSKVLVWFDARYATFAAPYALMLLSYAIYRISVAGRRGVRRFFYPLIAIQIIIMTVSLSAVYEDRPHNRRRHNPYVILAEEIRKSYKNGDIVVYPDKEDALLTSLYLRGNNSILQTIDPRVKDEVLLIDKISGNRRTLLSFDGGKRRY